MIGRNDKYADPSSAQTYADNNAVQFKQASDFLLSYQKYLKSPLLDVGCGTGELTAYIGEKFKFPITGVDISEARIKYANAKHSSAQTVFFIGNAVKLDQTPWIVNKLFGTVVSFNALHHIPQKDQLEAFKQIRLRLKPNGSALLLIPGRSPTLHDSINETTKNSRWNSYFSDFNITSVRTYETAKYYNYLCSQAGFFRTKVISSLEAGGKEFNFEEMKKFLSGWIPQLAHLKEKISDATLYENIKDKFLSDVTTLYFFKMNKTINETVTVTINQNKIITHAPGEQKVFRSRL